MKGVRTPRPGHFPGTPFQRGGDGRENLHPLVQTAHSRSSASANSGTAANKPIVISQRQHQGAWIWPGHKISRKFNDELRKLGYEQRETGFWNNRPSMVVVPERIAVVVPERIAVVVPERIAVVVPERIAVL